MERGTEGVVCNRLRPRRLRTPRRKSVAYSGPRCAPGSKVNVGSRGTAEAPGSTNTCTGQTSLAHHNCFNAGFTRCFTWSQAPRELAYRERGGRSVSIDRHDRTFYRHILSKGHARYPLGLRGAPFAPRPLPLTRRTGLNDCFHSSSPTYVCSAGSTLM